MRDISQIAFALLDRFRAAHCLSDIQKALQSYAIHFGYDSFILGTILWSRNQTFQECIKISDWPEEWQQRYQAQGYMRVDPVLRHMKGVVDPFLWHEAAQAAGSGDGGVVMNEARAFRLNEGFCVPFHQNDGSEAAISFGGEHMRLSPDEQAALHLVAIYAMSAVRTLTRPPPDIDRCPTPSASLTAREVECLKWSSAGKTAWEISVILSISRRTVEQYLTSAANKLQTVGRVHCVAEAIRRGIIA